MLWHINLTLKFFTLGYRKSLGHIFYGNLYIKQIVYRLIYTAKKQIVKMKKVKFLTKFYQIFLTLKTI